jgi:hypothetical protein
VGLQGPVVGGAQVRTKALSVGLEAVLPVSQRDPASHRVQRHVLTIFISVIIE